jgi:Membrane domain of glycerophosphoryl diester phosphodiesterase
MMSAHRFQVGTVLSKTFAAFFTRILPFSVYSLIGFLPSMIFVGFYFYYLNKLFGFFGQFPVPGQPVPQFDPNTLADLPWGWISAAFAGYTMVSLVTTAIWLAATSFGAFQFMRGLPIDFFGSLRRGVSTALPCIGAMLLIFLGFYTLLGIAVLPFLSLINDIRETGTPEHIFRSIGIFFLTATAILFICVAIAVRLIATIPTITVERPGVLAAFRRSWNLTRGNFWRIFGIGLVLLVAFYALSIPIGILAMILTFVVGPNGIWIAQGANIVLSMAANAIFAIAAAVIYVELRRAKEGFGIEDIAAVFD